MDKKKQLLRYLPLAAGLVLTLLIAVFVFFVKDLFQKPAQSKRQIQQVTILQPPPPPPPPPEIKPPEPEIKEEKIVEPEPEKEPDKAPEESEAEPSEQLGIDGEGGAGSDGFGLAARKGGHSLLGGSPGSTILWYGGQIKRGLEDELQNLLADSEARKAGYSVVLAIWVGTDGRVSRAELSGGSGKSEVDQAIKNALPKLRLGLLKPPPENMPQPVRVRITSRI